jgi:hypothetical protein
MNKILGAASPQAPGNDTLVIIPSGGQEIVEDGIKLPVEATDNNSHTSTENTTEKEEQHSNGQDIGGGPF